MGVDAGDFDNDGDEDLFMTELTGQGSNLYVNDGSGNFRDVSALSALGPIERAVHRLGHRVVRLRQRRLAGHPGGERHHRRGQRRRADKRFPYDQRKVLFRNLRDGRFEDVTSQAGAVFELSESGRGAAFGDIDNDGDVDVLVGNDGGRVRLLVNNSATGITGSGLRLVGKATGRDMLGARVAVSRDGSTIWRRARSDGSYGSANDPRVLVGLGTSTATPDVKVRWPDGRIEEWSDVPIDRWTTLKEGTGR